jgi:hypothetical protein
MRTRKPIDLKPTRPKRTIACFAGAISLAVLIPASGAFADTTQPNACVGQHIHTMAIPESGNIEAHADFHGVTVQQLLDHIREVACGR